MIRTNFDLIKLNFFSLDMKVNMIYLLSGLIKSWWQIHVEVTRIRIRPFKKNLRPNKIILNFFLSI